MEKKSGFTFVEVALVLAIAGLIFLMAFLALPSLWMSQRDADRKARVMEFISDVKTYQTNNSRGALPSMKGPGPEKFTFTEAREIPSSEKNTWKAMVKDYVAPDFADATGNDYNFYIVECLAENSTEVGVAQPCAFQSDFGAVNSPNNVDVAIDLDNPTIYVVIGATCDGDHAVRTNSSRSVAAVQVLERAGRYCYNT